MIREGESDMKRFFPLFLLMLIATACAATPNGSVGSGASSSQETAVWRPLVENYDPVYVDPCDAVSFPPFNGMTQQDFNQRALGLGYNFETHNPFWWAYDGSYSPEGRYLAYHSNKDCLDETHPQALSVIVLDLLSGEEIVLLSGAIGGQNFVRFWLDEQTLLCSKADFDNDNQTLTEDYFLCSVDGTVVPVDSFSSAPGEGIFGHTGRLLVTRSDQTLLLMDLGTDGSVTELAQNEFEGTPINNCGISPDGSMVCFVIRNDVTIDDRRVLLWNTLTDELVQIEYPSALSHINSAAIDISWQDSGFAITFNISDIPDANGHSELWLYEFSAE